MWFAQDAINLLARTDTRCYNNFQVKGMRWWKMYSLVICVGFQSRDVSDLEIFFGCLLGKICQGQGMSWWQLDTLIICVRF